VTLARSTVIKSAAGASSSLVEKGISGGMAAISSGVTRLGCTLEKGVSL